MAWTPPTPADLKVRFPAFASVPDPTIQAALDEATPQVDETWVSEQDFRLGRLLLAAHILTLDSHGDSSGDAAGFRRLRSGSLEIEPASQVDLGYADAGVLGSTAYGRRFLDLRRRNIPAVVAV